MTLDHRSKGFHLDAGMGSKSVVKRRSSVEGSEVRETHRERALYASMDPSILLHLSSLLRSDLEYCHCPLIFTCLQYLCPGPQLRQVKSSAQLEKDCRLSKWWQKNQP